MRVNTYRVAILVNSYQLPFGSHHVNREDVVTRKPIAPNKGNEVQMTVSFKIDGGEQTCKAIQFLPREPILTVLYGQQYLRKGKC